MKSAPHACSSGALFVSTMIVNPVGRASVVGNERLTGSDAVKHVRERERQAWRSAEQVLRIPDRCRPHCDRTSCSALATGYAAARTNATLAGRHSARERSN